MQSGISNNAKKSNSQIEDKTLPTLNAANTTQHNLHIQILSWRQHWQPIIQKSQLQNQMHNMDYLCGQDSLISLWKVSADTTGQEMLDTHAKKMSQSQVFHQLFRLKYFLSWQRIVILGRVHLPIINKNQRNVKNYLNLNLFLKQFQTKIFWCNRKNEDQCR
ncbi:unnamed protein product [Paramecium octaurelia]|uniref:Uncharacterized protein n=1 Tax=Paramecium octaurelia TaxID=43137 RepID=A0A8S1TVS2_PAROT|nr:unnamed protein product [Paramecium octaurelia]CAD8158003.1 unnamed protein product [Paramecium octaurelia]CAD8158011.1 unnamed protein product [Paramecium octaurelia]